MKNFTKALSLALLISLAPSNNTQAMTTANYIDIALKATGLVAVTYGLCKIGCTLADIRDILFEQLMQSNSAAPVDEQNNNGSITYVQAVSEHVDVATLDRDTQVYTQLSIIAPKKVATDNEDIFDYLEEEDDCEDEENEELDENLVV